MLHSTWFLPQQAVRGPSRLPHLSKTSYVPSHGLKVRWRQLARRMLNDLGHLIPQEIAGRRHARLEAHDDVVDRPVCPVGLRERPQSRHLRAIRPSCIAAQVRPRLATQQIPLRMTFAAMPDGVHQIGAMRQRLSLARPRRVVFGGEIERLPDADKSPVRERP